MTSHPRTNATTILARHGVAPLFFVTALMMAAVVHADDAALGKAANPKAVDAVKAGTCKTANAAWWGFNKEDATDQLQAAINSGAPKVIVPYMGDPWVVRPIMLRSNLELVFEPGVMILAKRGEFKGGGDSLFSANALTDVTLRGYGAIFRMWKKDYQNAPYTKAEWRMGVGIRGCKRVHVEGMRIESSGGDGIYVDGGGDLKWSEDVVIRNVTCHDHHRQGISVISAVNLLIENCVLSGTSGTPPEAGIDFEPDTADQRFTNCVVRNCVMENNSGHEILVYLKPLTSKSEPVSIVFENCVSRMGTPGMAPDDFKDVSQRGWGGMTVGEVRDDGPAGLVEFRNCVSENTGKEGAKVYDKSPQGVRVRFVNCSWKSPWVSRFRDDGSPRVPVLIQLRNSKTTSKQGGIEFVDCHVYDDVARPALLVSSEEGVASAHGLTGSLTAHTPGAATMNLGAESIDNTLTLSSEKN